MKKFFAENIANDIKLMNETLQSAFNALLWLRETLISYVVSDSGASVWLDVDLPEIEDFPQALDRIEPIESLAIYEHRQKMTATGIFKIIEPFELNNS
jgi:hypothetical protein